MYYLEVEPGLTVAQDSPFTDEQLAMWQEAKRLADGGEPDERS